MFGIQIRRLSWCSIIINRNHIQVLLGMDAVSKLAINLCSLILCLTRMLLILWWRSSVHFRNKFSALETLSKTIECLRGLIRFVKQTSHKNGQSIIGLDGWFWCVYYAVLYRSISKDITVKNTLFLVWIRMGDCFGTFAAFIILETMSSATVKRNMAWILLVF